MLTDAEVAAALDRLEVVLRRQQVKRFREDRDVWRRLARARGVLLDPKSHPRRRRAAEQMAWDATVRLRRLRTPKPSPPPPDRLNPSTPSMPRRSP